MRLAEIMNPYSIPLFAMPALMAIAASFLKNRWEKWLLLLLAIVTFWAILQPAVHWAFAHPFNPADGAAKAFAWLFGWAYGLIEVILPAYWISKGFQWLARKKRQRMRPPG